MENVEIFFCGLSKNNYESLKKNIDYLLQFKNESKYSSVNLLIVDSNSEDGSKELLNKTSSKYDFFNVVHKDDINLVDSRVERIKICRNLCLQFIDKKSKNNFVIYIPFDTDFFPFSNTKYIQLDLLISKVINNKIPSGIFPASKPFYYDIFALRAPGWLNINSQLVVSRLKKYLRIGSFIFNYLFIFRYQLSPEKIESKKYTLVSAFGGIGIYNVSNLNLSVQKYEINNKLKEWFSEHLYFNQHFENLEIETSWVVDAPKEHVMYKSLDNNKKLLYFLKSFKEDIKSFLRKRQ